MAKPKKIVLKINLVRALLKKSGLPDYRTLPVRGKLNLLIAFFSQILRVPRTQVGIRAF